MPQLYPDLVIHQRYQLQRPLGRGGFSIVWLALDLKDRNNPVALKISLPDKDPDGEQPIRMEKQHHTTMYLDHKHLLRSNDFFMVEDAGCLVFDYMAGGTLHHQVKMTGVLPEREVAKLMQQLGGALQYLHEHALIHFDIKPENILIDAAGNYYIADFDTASRLENSMVRVSRIYADTPQYRSPEHLKGAAELSEKVDIFALGTTIFEACEGIMEKEYGIGLALLSGLPKPTLEGNYARRLENLVHACWNHNPSDRPTAEALESYANHLLLKNFWPPVIEYKPDDKPIEGPGSKNMEAVRVTVGRPTVVVPQPSGVPAEKPSKGAAVPTVDWLSPILPQEKTSKPKSWLRRWGGAVLAGTVIILVAAFFIRNWVIMNYQFSEKIKNSEALKGRNLLRDAFDELQDAEQMRPNDSVAIHILRREILKIALEQHTVELNLARQALQSKKYQALNDMISALESNKSNASILAERDSTHNYLGKLKATKAIHFSRDKKHKTNIK